MMNDPYGAQGAVRAPRLRVMCNGVAMPGVISASITSNNYYHCDSFHVSFAESVGLAGWWDVPPPLVLDIQLSLSDAAWVSLIVGEVDHMTAHGTTRIVNMEGRDMSARLIEAKTQEAFPNQTASQVAATLAARHGMSTAITATTTLTGRYYEVDHSHITLSQFSKTATEWDLLVSLAQREGFDVFMQGSTLHFQPATKPDADPYVINYAAQSNVPRMNAINVTRERSLTLAKDVRVKVQVWNSRQGRAFTKTAGALGKSSGAGTSSGGQAATTQQYALVRSNLTEDQAQQLANQTAMDLTKHERIVSVEMPGELTLTPRSMVKLQGTASSFDQVYFIDAIERSISVDEGFRQSMRLKNSSPRTQTQV